LCLPSMNDEEEKRLFTSALPEFLRIVNHGTFCNGVADTGSLHAGCEVEHFDGGRYVPYAMCMTEELDSNRSRISKLTYYKLPPEVIWAVSSEQQIRRLHIQCYRDKLWESMYVMSCFEASTTICHAADERLCQLRHCIGAFFCPVCC
jgi:hypothetical protein